MDIRSALRLGIAQLRARGVPSDTLAAELLLLHATGRSLVQPDVASPGNRDLAHARRAE